MLLTKLTDGANAVVTRESPEVTELVTDSRVNWITLDTLVIATAGSLKPVNVTSTN